MSLFAEEIHNSVSNLWGSGWVWMWSLNVDLCFNVNYSVYMQQQKTTNLDFSQIYIVNRCFTPKGDLTPSSYCFTAILMHQTTGCESQMKQPFERQRNFRFIAQGYNTFGCAAVCDCRIGNELWRFKLIKVLYTYDLYLHKYLSETCC